MSTSDPVQDIAALLEGLSSPSWARRVDALREATARLAAGEFDDDAERQLAPKIISIVEDEKWEVRKAAALALAELQHVNSESANHALVTLSEDTNRWVSQSAARALQRTRRRAHRRTEWALTEDTQNPTLAYIAARIRKIGLRSMSPAQLYDLAMEVGEQFYRELAADTAHEIRTLLTPLEGYIVELARHLAEGGRANASTDRYIQQALSRLHHLEALVEQIHTYTEPVASDYEPVELARLVEDAVRIGTERGAGDPQGVSIVKHVSVPVEIIVDALPEGLTRAVANIVANACQAMRNGGTLTVLARFRGAGFVELAVKDTGQGMAPEDVEHALERFRTTRRDRGGTGLGLPIAKRIVEGHHGGELSIESTPGEGTTVTIELPVRQSPREE